MSTPADFIKTSIERERVQSVVDEYRSFHEGSVEARKASYTRMVNDYYDLATDFYEFGWGDSFHFAPRHAGETFAASLARHEMFLALRLGLRPGMEALDVGCGIGGPMRTIARFSGARVMGVNNNDYQIGRLRKLTDRAGLGAVCRVEKADFMHLPFTEGRFQGIYAIEATCHAPDKLALFRELYRVLEPGGSFAGYEWCLTDRFRAGDSAHQRIKKDIEEGDGLPDIWPTGAVDDALREAGFELVEARDIASDSDARTPWWHPLAGGFTLSGITRTRLGRRLTHGAVQILEKARVAPQGTTTVSTLLNTAADALVAGGRTGIFTPMYFFHARRPR